MGLTNIKALSCTITATRNERRIEKHALGCAHNQKAPSRVCVKVPGLQLRRDVIKELFSTRLLTSSVHGTTTFSIHDKPTLFDPSLERCKLMASCLYSLATPINVIWQAISPADTYNNNTFTVVPSTATISGLLVSSPQRQQTYRYIDREPASPVNL